MLSQFHGFMSILWLPVLLFHQNTVAVGWFIVVIRISICNSPPGPTWGHSRRCRTFRGRPSWTWSSWRGWKRTIRELSRIPRLYYASPVLRESARCGTHATWDMPLVGHSLQGFNHVWVDYNSWDWRIDSFFAFSCYWVVNGNQFPNFGINLPIFKRRISSQPSWIPKYLRIISAPYFA